MSVPRLILCQAEERPKTYGSLPAIDKTRATAVLVRQSGRKADTLHEQSRETQLEQQGYAELLYGSDEPKVWLYDEGAGVSGQKRIDQRKKVRSLYRDIMEDLVGTIVLAREDRLFRNKHLEQVGQFTKLLEEKQVKIIIPPTEDDEGVTVYDFTIYDDLSTFQDKMKEAYGYIEGHVAYMHQQNRKKAAKGGYDGRFLPPGLALKEVKKEQRIAAKRPKKEHIIVIYEPWAEVLRKLALRAQALNWDLGKLNREIADRDYLFPEIPEKDREELLINTNLYHVPTGGYKPRDHSLVRQWLTNILYIGWWQPNKKKPYVVPNHHPALLDRALFAEGYAQLTGETLEGEPVENPLAIKRTQKKRERVPEALFHSKLIAFLSPDKQARTSVVEDKKVLNYIGYTISSDGMNTETILSIPVAQFDVIVIERLKALVSSDMLIQHKVKNMMENEQAQREEEALHIDKNLLDIEKNLKINARKIADENDDKLEKELREKRKKLLATQANLELQKKNLERERDDPKSIDLLHKLLSDFDTVWKTFDILQKQRLFHLLINRIEVEGVSPHWLRLSIDWLDAVNPRIDVAYVWRVSPSRGIPFSKEDKEMIKEAYPSSPRTDLLKLFPDRTWHAIQQSAKGIKREVSEKLEIPINACWHDFMSKEGEYLFMDYETTLNSVRMACENTNRNTMKLFPLWIPKEKSRLETRHLEERVRTLVCSYLKHAASGLDSHEPYAPDDNYVWCGKGMLYLRKAMALSAPNMKGSTSEKMSYIIEDAKRLIDPELIRRHVISEVFLAQDHFAAGSYEWATEAALGALEKSRPIRSRLNRARIEGLYQQLLNTSYRHKPYLAYLGVKLRTWDHGMG